MNKEELVRYATSLLRSGNARKPIRIQRHTFHISDDDGNVAHFVMKKQDKSVIYTIDDVRVILEALIQATEEAIKQGESVSIYGFGTLGLKWREPRETRDFKTGERVTIEGRYVPKFSFGNILRTCANVYAENKDTIEARKKEIEEMKDMPWYAFTSEIDEDGEE